MLFGRKKKIRDPAENDLGIKGVSSYSTIFRDNLWLFNSL